MMRRCSILTGAILVLNWLSATDVSGFAFLSSTRSVARYRFQFKASPRKDHEKDDNMMLNVLDDQDEGMSKVDTPLRLELTEANQKAAAAEVTVAELQSTLQEAQSQLLKKERRLRRNEKAWEKKKSELVSRIDELDGLLDGSASVPVDNNTVTATPRQNLKLQGEISQLEGLLSETQTALAMEQEKADALRIRLEDASDQYEYEQMRFRRDQKNLETKLGELKSKLFTYDKEMTVNQMHFDTERTVMEDQINEVTTNLIGMERQMELQEKEFQLKEHALAQTVEEQSEMIKAMKEKLSTVQSQFASEKQHLEDSLKQQEVEFRSKEAELASAIAEQADTIVAIQSRYATDVADLEGGLRTANETAEDLETRIMFEIAKVNKLTSQLEEERETFQRERGDLNEALGLSERQLAAELQHLSNKKVEVGELNRTRKKLKTVVKEQTAKIEALEQQLNDEQKLFDAEKIALEETVYATNKRLQEMEGLLLSNQKVANETTEDMEMRIIYEITKTNKLADQLAVERQMSRSSIESLERSLSEKQSRINEVEELLVLERKRTLIENEQLQAEIVRGDELRKQKAHEMKKRYDEIRSEMTALWQEEKRKSRSEKIRLNDWYKDRVASLKSDVSRLEEEVKDAESIREQLAALMEEQGVLLEMKELSETMLQQKSRLAASYRKTVHDRDEAISGLVREIGMLKSGIAKRDEKMEKDKSSFRTLLRMMLDLLKSRLEATRGRSRSRPLLIGKRRRK